MPSVIPFVLPENDDAPTPVNDEPSPKNFVAVTLPVATILLEFKLILAAVMLTLLVALILKSEVEVIEPVPVAVDMNVLENTLPVNLIFPPETILKSPVAVNVPVPVAAATKLLAITLPALMLPVYVGNNARTFERTLAFV